LDVEEPEPPQALRAMALSAKIAYFLDIIDI
jgi:hypothetical protein